MLVWQYKYDILSCHEATVILKKKKGSIKNAQLFFKAVYNGLGTSYLTSSGTM